MHYARMGQANLTVLTRALVTRIVFKGNRAAGVEVLYEGKLLQIEAALEVIVSLGAIQTPKLLMQSGIGDRDELTKFGIPVVEHLPGVGRHLHDHVALGIVWDATEKPVPRTPRSQAVCFWKTNSALDAPNFYLYARGGSSITPENQSPIPVFCILLVAVPWHAAGQSGRHSPHRSERVRSARYSSELSGGPE